MGEFILVANLFYQLYDAPLAAAGIIARLAEQLICAFITYVIAKSVGTVYVYQSSFFRNFKGENYYTFRIKAGVHILQKCPQLVVPVEGTAEHAGGLDAGKSWGTVADNIFLGH